MEQIHRDVFILLSLAADPFGSSNEIGASPRALQEWFISHRPAVILQNA